MEYIIKDETETNRLPEVGELWTHGPQGTAVFMRINDLHGIRALRSVAPEGTVFFSVSIKDGKVVGTGKSAHDIIIMEPVGGTLELQVKR